MPQIKELFFENILFDYKGYACDCVEDLIHSAPGVPAESMYKIQSLADHPVHFGYVPKKGLVRIGANGAIEEENILGKLLALPVKGYKEFRQFLLNNGFIFPASDTKYEAFDVNAVKAIINRLKATVDLMAAVAEIHKNYNKIATLAIKLLFAEPFSLQTSAMDTPYISCAHTYPLLLNNPPELTPEREQEAFNGNKFIIADSIFGTYSLPIEDYSNITGGQFGSAFHLFPELTQLYVNHSGTENDRLFTDFLFHCYYNSKPETATFIPEMQTAAIKVAKLVIAEELNANLGGIRLIYDANTMKPAWKIDNLLCAAYLSIFYLDPEMELMRPCANPKCNNYFLVRATSTRVRYCCTECCNRVTQDRYRKRKREKTENK